MLNIVIPMAGRGSPFQDAGYVFPKPLIDIKGKTMIEIVVNNLRPNCEHRFIFICQKDQFEKYDFYNILKNATSNKFEIVLISDKTEGAACTVLTALQYINNENDLIIANADQFIEININDFITAARASGSDGTIMTFESSHPRWSYVRTDASGNVLEAAEKKVISHQATVGIYYFKKGSGFVAADQAMIYKNIRYNNEFYICPVYNELILEQKKVGTFPIAQQAMNSLGTPSNLSEFIQKIDKGTITL